MIPTHDDKTLTDAAGEVRLTIRSAVATLTLSRPKAHNALTWAMYDQLNQYFDTVSLDQAVRVVVLRGDGGRAFAAGTDINQFATFDGNEGVAYEQRVDAIISKLAAIPKPTVAAIEGYVVGGGLALASACDLRYGNTLAKLGMPIARTLGNCLAIQNYRRLADILGVMKLKELIYTGRLMDAHEGLASGFLTQIFAPEEFDARINDIVGTIAANAPLTLWATKVALSRLEEARHLETEKVPYADVVEKVYGSEDFHAAVLARKTKATVVWRGC